MNTLCTCKYGTVNMERWKHGRRVTIQLNTPCSNSLLMHINSYQFKTLASGLMQSKLALTDIVQPKQRLDKRRPKYHTRSNSVMPWEQLHANAARDMMCLLMQCTALLCLLFAREEHRNTGGKDERWALAE